MAQKLYKRLGLRRDRNFSDLGSSTDSLNNLLNPLADISESATFISEDLNCIRGVSSTGLTTTGYRSIADLTLQQTDANGINQPVRPLQTLKNRLDIIRVVTGNDPTLNGGPGLFPKFYSSVNGDGYTDGSLVSGSGEELTLEEKNQIEWLYGEFTFDGSIKSSSSTNKGAYVWEGFFVPTESGNHSIRVLTDGYFRLEFQDETYTGVGINTYTTLFKTGITTTITANGDSTTDQISNFSDVGVVGVGMTINGSNISADSIIEEESGASYTLNTGAITGNFTNQSINLFKSKENFGEVLTDYQRFTYPLIEYQRYYFKLTYFIPDSFTEEESNKSTILRLIFGSPNNSLNLGNIFPYYYLYPLDYNFNNTGTLDTFIKSSLPKSGGSIGSDVTIDDYISVTTSSKVEINYIPPSSISSIKNKTLTNVGLSTIRKVLSVDSIDGIEVGNYVFSIGSGIQYGGPNDTRVLDVKPSRNGGIIVFDTFPTNNVTRTLEFFDHRGFVKAVTGSISGTTLTISSGDANTLRTGMLVIGDGVTQYTGITTTGSPTTVTVNESQTVGAGTTLYFYESKGLINNSLDAFCLSSETRCLVANGIQGSGSTQLTVESTAGISNGWYVYGSQFVGGTTVQSVDNATTLTITSATINAIADGANFTVSSSSQEQKSLCCPPTDTSPPFNATEEGIDTTPSFPSLNFAGTISFNSLSIGVSTVVSNYSGSGDDSNSRFTIEAANGNFDILCV